MRTIFTVIIAFLTIVHAVAQGSWGLDPSFGTNGKIITSVSPPIKQMAGASMSVIQPDGKIIVGGNTYNDRHIVLMRFHPNGSPDSTFGGDGMVETGAGPWNSLSSIAAIALQPDGKIVAAGMVDNPTNEPMPNNDFLLLRYNTDGSLDNTFGLNGEVITNLYQEENNTVSIALQPDGKILLGGATSIATTILRYHIDGSLDATFGIDGVVRISLNENYWNSVATITLQQDGKIVGAGYTVDTVTLEFNLAFARFNTDGSLDTTFGTGGVATMQAGSLVETITSVAVQPDGKIVAGGWGMDTSNYQNCKLVRCLSNGIPDTSFGTNGVVSAALSDKGDFIQSLLLQPDGKIVVTGEYYTGAALAAFDYDFMVARYLANGTPDTGFGNSGMIVTDFGSQYDIAKAVSLQPDGKIIVVGESGEHPAFALARYALESPSAVSGQEEEAIKHAYAYPNPVVEDRVNLSYELSKTSIVTVSITDISGSYASTLIKNESRPKGRHQETLVLPEGLAPGVYLLRISSNDGSAGITILKK